MPSDYLQYVRYVEIEAAVWLLLLAVLILAAAFNKNDRCLIVLQLLLRRRGRDFHPFIPPADLNTDRSTRNCNVDEANRSTIRCVVPAALSSYPPPLPGLTRTAVKRIAKRWDDGGLWDDIQVLANRFWAARDDETRLVCWHHLVLAVGNFKRQPGRRLRPSPLTSLGVYDQFVRTSEITVPSMDGQHIHVNDPLTWDFLMRALPGARVATTTALLAALWPDQHIVFDRRVHWAANALRICSKLSPSPGVEPSSSRWHDSTLNDYNLIRGWILTTAELLRMPPNMVERTLYILDRQVPSFKGETWSHYAERICEQLATLAS